MAAVSLHHAIRSPEPVPSHSRDVSTISDSTFNPNVFETSHQTEPLLASGPQPRQLNYDIYYPHVPVHDEERVSGLPRLPSNVINAREQRGSSQKSIRTRLRKLRILKIILEVLLGIWAIFNTVRYFIAFTTYMSTTEGQATSLALGTSAALSLAFAVCSYILLLFESRLLVHRVRLRTLLAVQARLQYVSSFLLLAPAIVNLVFLILWRNTLNPELEFSQRCQLDIDIVWSVPTNECNKSPASWGVWVGLSSSRVAVTFIIIVLYHLVSVRYYRTHYPPQQARLRPPHYHKRNKSSQSALPDLNSLTSLAAQSNMMHQSSESTLASLITTQKPISQRRLHRATSSSALSQSSASSQTHINATPTQGLMELPILERDNVNFVDRFHHLVSQIAREADDAVDFARSEDSNSAHNLDTISPVPVVPNTIEGYNFPISPTIGYNEFGQPYPPEEQILVMNGIIRRMPTIESMGSREMGTSIGASSVRERATGSRPPTRNTTLLSNYTGGTGSEPPSRTASLVARAEMIVAMTEFGERNSPYGGEVSQDTNRLSLAEPTTNSGAITLSTSSSRSTGVTYHTAAELSTVQLVDSTRSKDI